MVDFVVTVVSIVVIIVIVIIVSIVLVIVIIVSIVTIIVVPAVVFPSITLYYIVITVGVIVFKFHIGFIKSPPPKKQVR